MSAAASAKILRLNADEGALRDLRFAVRRRARACGKPFEAVARSRRPAAQPRPGPDRRRGGALDLALPDPNGLASSLKACAGEGDPVSAADKSAALVFSAFPDAPAAEAEILALWAVRHGHRHPAALAAAPAADRDESSRPGSTVGRRQRRPRPGDPAWPKAAAGAIALAAASALDLAADLSRRSEHPASPSRPNCAPKPAAKIVDLLLGQDCVSPAEAARHAPMTDRAARRLFDRLVALGAAREFSGRPTFRLYGL